jgi:hypothetical protein
LGAEAALKGSRRYKSCGDTVPMFVEVLEVDVFKSKTLGRAGEEYDVAEPASRPARSSKVMSSTCMVAT